MNYFLIKKILVVGTLVFMSSAFLLAPATSFGQENTRIAKLSDGFQSVRDLASDSRVQSTSLKENIKEALKIVMALVGVVTLAVIVIGGFLYITSAGDEKKAGQAKMLILYAIIGVLIIGASVIIVNVVLDIFS